MDTADLADVERRVRMAARALGRAGLVHAYGHCSARVSDGQFLVCAPRPMALIESGEPGSLCEISGALPDGVLGEVRMHQTIYAKRPDVGGICRVQPFHVMALSAGGLVPEARHGFGAYLAGAVTLWPHTALVRDDKAADGVASTLADGVAVVLRGNGAVVAGSSIEEAVVLTWYLEDAARLELAVRSAGIDGRLTASEAAARAVWSGGILDRMWDYLTAGDPESRGSGPPPQHVPAR